MNNDDANPAAAEQIVSLFTENLIIIFKQPT